MTLSVEEVLAVLIAGILAGAALAWIERAWPTSGIGRV